MHDQFTEPPVGTVPAVMALPPEVGTMISVPEPAAEVYVTVIVPVVPSVASEATLARSEERRVGKECRL